MELVELQIIKQRSRYGFVSPIQKELEFQPDKLDKIFEQFLSD